MTTLSYNKFLCCKVQLTSLFALFALCRTPEASTTVLVFLCIFQYLKKKTDKAALAMTRHDHRHSHDDCNTARAPSISWWDIRVPTKCLFGPDHHRRRPEHPAVVFLSAAALASPVVAVVSARVSAVASPASGPCAGRERVRCG